MTDDSWRTGSASRRRNEIFTTSFTPTSSCGYKSSLSSPHGKYSNYTPSPLSSPSLLRRRKLSISNNNFADDVRNTKNRFPSTDESSLSRNDTNTETIDYKELYEEEKKEKEVN